MQNVWRCGNLWSAATLVLVPLAGTRNTNTGQVAYPAGLVLAPAKKDCQAFNAIEWMCLMGTADDSNRSLVARGQDNRWCVVAAVANAQYGQEVSPPSQVDFFQDG